MRYLDGSSRRPLLRCVEDELLRPHAARLLAVGVPLLADAHRAPDLRRLLDLFEVRRWTSHALCAPASFASPALFASFASRSLPSAAPSERGPCLL